MAWNEKCQPYGGVEVRRLIEYVYPQLARLKNLFDYSMKITFNLYHDT